MTRRLILLRHGQTHYNATMRMQGQLDTTLSEQGHKQARLAAEVIAYRHPFALYSSDLQRARKTADATCMPIRACGRRTWGSGRG